MEKTFLPILATENNFNLIDEASKIRYQLTDALTSATSIKDATRKILDVMVRTDSFDCGAIYYLDHAADTLSLDYQAGIPIFFPGEIAHSRSHFLNAPQFMDGELMYLVNPSNLPGLSNTIIRDKVVHAVAILPLQNREQVNGALYLISCHLERIPSPTLVLVQSIGLELRRNTGQFSNLRDATGAPEDRFLAWHNPQPEKTVSEQENGKIQRQAEYLVALHDTTLDLISEFDLDHLLNTITSRAAALVGTSHAAIILKDENSHQMIVRIGIGFFRNKLGTPWEAIANVAREVWLSGKPIIIDDLVLREESLNADDRIHALAAFPLYESEKEITGILVLLFMDQGIRFRENEVEILDRFAALASVTIKNARLHAKVKNELEERRRVQQQLKNLTEELEKRVKARTMQLHTLSRRLVEVQELERRNLARELHDEIGQLLTGINFTLETAARKIPDPVAYDLTKAQDMTNQLIEKVRELSLDLRPSILDDLGLVNALHWLFERVTSTTGMRIDYEFNGLDGKRFNFETETAVYRITQEALTNAARYAGVDHISVHIGYSHSFINLEISDKGIGFDMASIFSIPRTAGLSGMRERAILLGGICQIQSAPGKGTKILVEIPT